MDKIIGSVLLVLTILIQIIVSFGYCQKGWIKHGKKCYTIFPPDPKQTTVSGLEKAHCAQYGGTLMNVKTEQLNNMAIVLKNSIPGLVFVAIGLSDKEEEGVFRWSDGQRVARTLSNWREGEPTNANFSPENCVVIGKDDRWNDIVCESSGVKSYGILCEKPVEEVIIVQPRRKRACKGDL